MSDKRLRIGCSACEHDPQCTCFCHEPDPDPPLDPSRTTPAPAPWGTPKPLTRRECEGDCVWLPVAAAWSCGADHLAKPAPPALPLGHARRYAIKSQEPFGDYYAPEMPSDCDMVIVCKNDGHGLEPQALYLPHQVYVKQWGNTPGLTLIPANSAHYIEVAKPQEKPRAAPVTAAAPDREGQW